MPQLTPEQWTALITAATPFVLGVGGGIWALAQWLAARRDKAEKAGLPVTQGQTADLTTHLQTERVEAESEARIFRDRLIQLGEDPDDLLARKKETR